MHTIEEMYAQVREEKASPSLLEFGSFANEYIESPPPKKLIVAAFNIRYAAGSFLISGSVLRRAGFARPSRRQALVLKNVGKAARLFSSERLMPAPDLIALQEADKGTKRAGGVHVTEELARALKMNYVHSPMILPRGRPPQAKRWYLDFEESLEINERGETGVAFLSRAPLREAERLDLPSEGCAWRPRLALSASLPFGEQLLRAFNLHIDPHGNVERRLLQHKAVLARIEKLPSDEPVIILGDFNTLTREARKQTRALLEENGFKTPMPSGASTWRAGLVRLHTDWIFARGARVTRWGIARQRGVSDHWPVWAEIESID